MARAVESAHPVRTLRATATSLEAAILVCLARPGKKAVHALRTSTRRVEAQLELLSLLPGLPPHTQPRRRLLRLLKKLRRAAGDVRDLDVQRDLIREEASGKHRGLPSNPDLRKEAKALRRDLKHKRNHLARELLDLLQKHRLQLPLAVEDLLDALAPAQSLSLSAARLTALVEHWYAHPSGHPAVSDETTHLHGIRKRAKLARYLAESAPKSARAARRLAAHFEKLQEAGGKWHDWLLLRDLSIAELGDSATLPRRFATHAQQSLQTFRRQLRKSTKK